MITTGQSSYASLLAQIFMSKPSAILLVAYIVDGAQIVVDYHNVFAFQGGFCLFSDSLEYSTFVQGAGAIKFTFHHEAPPQATPTSGAHPPFPAPFPPPNTNFPRH